MDLFQHVRVIPLGGGQLHFFFLTWPNICHFLLFSGKRKGQKSRMTHKIDFFKVQDIDIPIQSRKKKYQTNVSSALKTF